MSLENKLKTGIEELIEKDEELRVKAEDSILELKQCRQCGWCCNNKRILVTIPEMIRILKHTGKKFSEVFIIEDNKLSVSIKTVETYGKPYCMFFKDFKCQIHDVKPFQCRTYPVTFHPQVFEFHKPIVVSKSIFKFKCGSPLKKKAEYLVRIDDFYNIAQERLAFLIYNYKIQRKLIIRGELEKIVEEYVNI